MAPALYSEAGTRGPGSVTSRIDPLSLVGQDAGLVRALLLRFGLSGALAGVLVGGAELSVGLVRHAFTFAPQLAAFLFGLYALAGLAAGLALGVLASVLASTDLGAISSLPEGSRPAERLGSRVVAYGIVGVLTLLGVGFIMRPLVERYLVFFHHHQLIAALCGATTAGLALGALFVTLLLAPILSQLLPFGPRVRQVLRAPLFAVPGVVIGAYGTAALVGAHLLYLMSKPRMLPATRALNAALAAPLFVLLGALIGYLAYRAAGKRDTKATPLRVLFASLLCLLLPLLVVASLGWSTVRQLDLRPFYGAAALVLILLVVTQLLHRFNARLLVLSVSAFALLSLATVVICGKQPAARKAAAQTGLGPHLAQAVQLMSDLDRDGYSSLLGGGDCNDLDARVHPGAFDWPDDGIDQDCNGHEATLAGPVSRHYAEVPPTVPERPNVLLLTLDALRADHVSAYGYSRQTTPRLDALAADGALFANAWSHAPSTRYSVPAILIGRYPSTIAVNNDPRVHWPPQVLPENRLVSEMMKDLGYRTAATLSYHYFERGWGLDQGFDDYDYHLYTLHSVGGDPSATAGSSSKELADLDIEWLNKQTSEHPDQPFFMWSHYYDTHYRFDAHPDLPETHFGTDEQAMYDGEIRYADHHIGRVFDRLRELGLWDKTIIIVTSDHGDGFGEHGIPVSKRHGYHLYRTETKVPVIIRVPGLSPRVVKTPIGHVDLLPTLMNVLRRPATEEPQLLGESLLSAMLGDDSQKDARSIYQEVWYEGPTSKRAIVNVATHLVRNLVPEDTTELYDLVRDPAEDHDLSGTGDEREKPLLARLAEVADALAIPLDFGTRLKDARSTTPGTPTIVLGDTLGDLVTIRGVDVAPATLRTGESTDLTVHLDIQKPIAPGWVLFTHVVGPGGRNMNLDHAPLASLVPIEELVPGTFVRDPIRVSLPANWPVGTTRVEYGLYRKGQHAPARGAHSTGDGVMIATLEVTR